MLFAVLAAAFYAFHSPFSKWLHGSVPPMLMAAFLYLGAGLSIVFYIYAQRELGAAKTSAYYAIAPFIGVALSLIIFSEVPSMNFVAALVVMIAGTWVVTVADSPSA